MNDGGRLVQRPEHGVVAFFVLLVSVHAQREGDMFALGDQQEMGELRKLEKIDHGKLLNRVENIERNVEFLATQTNKQLVKLHREFAELQKQMSLPTREPARMHVPEKSALQNDAAMFQLPAFDSVKYRNDGAAKLEHLTSAKRATGASVYVLAAHTNTRLHFDLLLLTITAIRRNNPATTIVLVDNGSRLPTDLSFIGKADEATARWMEERLHIVRVELTRFEIGAYAAGLDWLDKNSMVSKFDRFMFQQCTVPTVPPLFWPKTNCHFAASSAHTGLMVDRTGAQLLLKTQAFNRSIETFMSGFREDHPDLFAKAQTDERSGKIPNVHSNGEYHKQLKQWSEHDISGTLLTRSKIEKIMYEGCKIQGSEDALKGAPTGLHDQGQLQPYWIKISGTSLGGFEHVNAVAAADFFAVSDTNFDGNLSREEVEKVVVSRPGLFQEIWSSFCMMMPIVKDPKAAHYMSSDEDRRPWESSGKTLSSLFENITQSDRKARQGSQCSLTAAKFWLEEALIARIQEAKIRNGGRASFMQSTKERRRYRRSKQWRGWVFYPIDKMYPDEGMGSGVEAWSIEGVWGKWASMPEEQHPERSAYAARFAKSLFQAADVDSDQYISFTEFIMLVTNEHMGRWALPHCLAAGDWLVAEGDAKSKELVLSPTRVLPVDLLMVDFTKVDQKQAKDAKNANSHGRDTVVSNSVLYTRWAMDCGCQVVDGLEGCGGRLEASTM
jgi:hypothetical protein